MTRKSPAGAPGTPYQIRDADATPLTTAKGGEGGHVWAMDVIHPTIAGARVESVRSHLSTADLARLAADGGWATGPRAKVAVAPPNSRMAA